jgi:hypothetical protein
MPESAQNVAIEVGIERAAQGRVALAWQAKALTARTSCARARCGWPPGRPCRLVGCHVIAAAVG